ncbi:putative secreted protein [Propionispora sp. 2/2-37]|uniref:TonB-dependent receptor plug domain-containing protein n=1 Tax=Propionispora sp. 2/2-37 TaxID=1677858 RepID=UPI0006BB89F6|nr:TonB-dependent receptor [Propionispora sp. 2/2-37]CUH97705.1 putative secreted protein [Propionispora sp. 2/2-37]
MKRRKYPKANKMMLVSLGIMTALSLPIQAEEEIFQLDETVVTATRTEQKVKETPASVEVITRKDIETMGAERVVTALKLALNLNLSEASMVGNQVSLRGMNTNQTLILIDGRRMAGEDAGSTANVYELDRVNINNVERIEIVRGPVSSLYGSEALGGVINIIMRKPEKPQSTIGLSTGSKQQNASYHLDLGKQGKWAWTFDTLFTDIQKQRRSETTNMYGPRQFYNISGTYDLAEGKNIDVFYERMSEHLKTTDYTDDGGREYFTNTRNSYGLTYRGRTTRGNYELRTYYNELEKNTDQLEGPGSYSDFDRANYKTWAIDGKNTMRLQDDHVLTFGGEYRTSEYRGTRLEDNGDAVSTVTEHGISKSISEKSVDYQAVYVQDEWKLSDKLLLIPSLRYDDSNRFEDSLSPKLGMTYHFADNFRLKTNFGKGFKAPSISELYMKMTRRPIPTRTVIVIGNPDLKPEKSTSYDISLEGEKGAAFGKLTYFDNDVTDLIGTETTRAGSVSTSKYVNIDKARIKGVELEAGRHLSNNFTVKTAYTFLDAKNAKTGEFLQDRAKNRYSVQLHYDDAQRTGISSILWYEWVRDYRYKDDEDKDTDYNYGTLNFTINKKWNERYSTYFGVDNILDKKIDELVLEGRLWRVGMNYTF